MSDAPRQNVIWIFGDQHRAQALSCNGDSNLQTPEIDRMAIEGANYRNAVCGFPLCCPFRGSLLTSQYPHRAVPGHEYPLPLDLKTVAHAFGEQGYRTAWFGKWHLAGIRERDGRAAFQTVTRERRGGFETWIGYDNNNSQWDSWVHGHTADGAEVERYRLPGYETDALTDLLIDYIRAQARRPSSARFFATLSVQPPHDPYMAPAEYMRRHNPARLQLRPNVPHVARIEQQARLGLAGAYAQIENLDWNVGRVRAALYEAGLDQDTYIVFFSDHGDMHGSQGHFHKLSPYEESLRIPFIIAGGPSVYDRRRTGREAVINHVDIAPTSLGLAGLPVPSWMAGTDYSGHYRKDRPACDLPESAYIQSVIPTHHSYSIDVPWRGVVTRDGWKYVCIEHQPWMLFNLNEDPYEQANLALVPRFKPERKRLHDMLRGWVERTGDSFPLPEV